MERPGSEPEVLSSARRSYEFRLGLQSDVGKKRSENQDAFGYLQTASSSLFIVADGMGGSRGGATASTATVNVVCKKALLQNREITPESIASAILEANQRVFKLSSEDRNLAGMGTTIVALGFVEDKAIVAHVGDSRIYRFSQGEIIQLTRDHSLIQDLLDSGTISEEEAENHPIAHMLTRSLGPTGEVEVEVRVVEEKVKPGDKFLLCSDGLLSHVKDEEIKDVVLGADVFSASERLLQLALERGGTDNITIQLIEAVALATEGALKPPPFAEVERVVSQEMELADEVVEEEYSLEQEKSSENVSPFNKIKLDNEPNKDSDKTPESEDTQLKGKLSESELPETASEVDSEDPIAFDLSKQKFRERIIEGYSLSSSLVAFGKPFLILSLVIFGVAVGCYQLFSSSNEQEAENIQIASRVDIVPEVKDPADQPPLVTSKQIANAESAEDSKTSQVASQVEATAPSSSSDQEELSSDNFTEEDISPETEMGEGDVAEEVFSQDVNKLSEELLNLAIPPLPERVFEVNSKHPTQEKRVPINWVAEEKGVADIKTQFGNESQQTGIIRAVADSAEAIQRKHAVRESLHDLELQAKILVADEQSIVQLETDLQGELEKLRQVYAEMDSRELKLRNRYQQWLEIKRNFSERRLLDIAENLATEDAKFAESYRLYHDALSKYFEADKAWQSDEDNGALAANVASSNKKLRQTRNKLHREAITAILRQLTKAEHSLENVGLLKFYSQSAIDRKNRAIGLLQGFRALTTAQRNERVERLIVEYNLKKDELDSYRINVSDREEIELRKKLILESFSNS